ncbi:MAG: hypothetical protein E7326_01360 [Clostridiales bacterium]|nr:hypothetical protein [Clostridiales bacterium]
MIKWMAAVLCALLFFMCAACAEQAWQFDADCHWQGEQNPAAHVWNDEKTCDICRVQVEWFDGLTDLYLYNDRGDLCITRSFLADGRCIDDTRREITYDDAGWMAAESVYEFGVLRRSFTYAMVETEWGPEQRTRTITEYREDGTYRVRTPDSDVILQFAADGTLTGEYDEFTAYDEYGYPVAIELWDGQVLVEKVCLEYDGNGYPVAERYYEQGRLVKECLYTRLDESGMGDLYVDRVLTYASDGTVTTTCYDRYGLEIE